MLDKLGRSLRDILKKISVASSVDKELIKEVVKDIQRALLYADVNVKLVLNLTKEVERRSLTERPPKGMSSREHVIKIIYEELVKILGKGKELEIKKQRILMVGLYGSGKTTTCGKLAKYFHKRGLKTVLIAGDTHRPAAYDQLAQIATAINVPIYGDRNELRAPKVVRDGLNRYGDYDVIIIDTAGRHSLDDDLITEIKRISQLSHPDETILVLDATTGQQAGPQAKAFHEAVGISGVTLTKLDGSAKGGGALSAVAETSAPIVFVGTGEHLDDLEKFEPTRFISRLLGMGDIQTLLEKVSEVITEEDAEKVVKKLRAGKFTLKDMYEQMELLSDMGPLKKLASLLPWAPVKLSENEINISQQRLKKFRIIMNSMTDEELENPRIVKSSRIMRIARGSGYEPKDVRELLKHYHMARRTVKGMMSNRKLLRQLAKQFAS